MIATQASPLGIGSGTFPHSAIFRWYEGRPRRRSTLVLVFLILILGLFPAVDLDNDPGSSNVPTAVLIAETGISREAESDRVKSRAGTR